jgi:adenylosuccinate lyase
MMTLQALSPLDGCYENGTSPLRDFFSEFAYLRTRARPELDFLSALSKTGLLPPVSISLNSFTDDNARKMQEYKKTTWHDVKPIKYYLCEKMISLSPENFTGRAVQITDDVIRSSDFVATYWND